MTKTRNLADLGGGFIQEGTGAVQRTVESKLQDVVSVKDFGAVGDGVTDDTVAIQNAINAVGLAGGGTVFLPAGVYLTSNTLTISDSGIGLMGAGNTQTTIKGNFANGDIVHVYNISAEIKNLFVTNLRIDTSVVKTSGAALHLEKVVRSSLRGVIASGQDGSKNLWNGYWFDKVDQIRVIDYECYAINNCLMVNGGGSGFPRGSDIYTLGGKLVSSAGFGVVVGGDVGGFSLDSGSCNDCKLGGVLIDQSLYAGGNREIFIGSSFYIDGQSIGGVRQQPGIVCNDPNLADLMLDGTWLNVHTIGLHVQQASSSTTEIRINGGQNGACDQDAIRIDALPRLLTVNGCSFQDITGWGVNCTVDASNLGGGEGVLISPTNRFRNCVAGDVTWNTIPPLPGTTLVRSITDDSVFSFKPRDLTTLGSTGLVMVNRVTNNNHLLAVYAAHPSNASMTEVSRVSIAMTTGVLNGTTGGDGNLTVSCATDEKIYIENRTGATITVSIALLVTYPGHTITGNPV